MNETTPHRSDPALQSALAEVAKRYEGDDHPAPERLLAYHRGELDEAAEAGVGHHLVGCERCAETLLDLAPLAQPEDPDAPSDFEQASAWKQIQPHLDRPATRPRGGAPKPLWALAAVLAAACLGLSVWVVQLREEVARAEQVAQAQPTPLEAQINVPIAYLDAVTRGESQAGSTRILLPEQGMFLLIVTPSDPTPDGRYRAEITSTAGERLWQAEGLRSSELGGVRIALPVRMLPAGALQVLLTGLAEDGAALTTDRYRLHLERAGAGD